MAAMKNGSRIKLPKDKNKNPLTADNPCAKISTVLNKLFCASGSVVEYRLAKARVAGSNPVSCFFHALKDIQGDRSLKNRKLPLCSFRFFLNHAPLLLKDADCLIQNLRIFCCVCECRYKARDGLR